MLKNFEFVCTFLFELLDVFAQNSEEKLAVFLMFRSFAALWGFG